MQLASVYDDVLRAGSDLWTVAPQDVTTNQGLRERRALPFPILADDTQSVIRSWGILNDQDPKRRAIPYPATYIVGPEMTIRWRYIGIQTRDRPTPGQLLAQLNSILDLS